MRSLRPQEDSRATSRTSKSTVGRLGDLFGACRCEQQHAWRTHQIPTRRLHIRHPYACLLCDSFVGCIQPSGPLDPLHLCSAASFRSSDTVETVRILTLNNARVLCCSNSASVGLQAARLQRDLDQGLYLSPAVETRGAIAYQEFPATKCLLNPESRMSNISYTRYSPAVC